jgi:superfamily II DNA or RNA helicase
MDHILKNTEIILYASLHKVSESYYDFIVLDECHGLTWKRLEHLHKIIIPTTKLFLLSATIPSDKKYLIEKLVNNKFVKYATISLDQAIKREMLPKPTIYVHQVNLNSADKLKYNNLQKQIVYFQRKNMFGPTKVSGLKRKKLIANSKTVCAKRIIALFKAKKYRFICFANDIKQAKLLALPKPVVCSKEQSAKFNQSLVDAFNRQQGDSLFAVKMLRESVNLTEIDRGLIIQLDKEPLSFYQMLGRCLRSKNPEMHMILCKDTHDQIYFDNVMDKSLLKYVVYV